MSDWIGLKRENEIFIYRFISKYQKKEISEEISFYNLVAEARLERTSVS